MDSDRSQQRLGGPAQCKTPQHCPFSQVCFAPKCLVSGLFKEGNQGNVSVFRVRRQCGEIACTKSMYKMVS